MSMHTHTHGTPRTHTHTHTHTCVPLFFIVTVSDVASITSPFGHISDPFKEGHAVG